MLTKEDLQLFLKDENALTIKVLKAVPEGQLEFRPHERSSDIKTLLKTFIAEYYLNMSFMKGEQPQQTMEHVKDFGTIADGINQLEAAQQEALQQLEQTPAEDLQQPFSAWGLHGTRAFFVSSMICDMIHHRGQLSVYVRLAGGKVPSIYGPSADEGFSA